MIKKKGALRILSSSAFETVTSHTEEKQNFSIFLEI